LVASQVASQEEDKSREYLPITDDWKATASTYIFHIRQVIKNAVIEEAIRERIFAKLNALQREIDRNRTTIEAITEVFLTITEAMGKGAKNLEGAVKLVERLAGAISGIRTESTMIEQELRRGLPAPEELGLSELPPIKDTPDEQE